MKNFYKTDKIVTFDETDVNSRLKFSAIFNYLQEAAANHADNLGWGMDYCTANNSFWVLSRINCEHLGVARAGDKLLIETWPTGFDRFFALRDFKIFNSSGDLIFKARSSWLMLDSKTKRPLRISKVFSVPEANLEDVVFDDFPNKIENVVSDNINNANRLVLYNDIDHNKHMNNARYITWLEDLIGDKLFENKFISKLEANYLLELSFNASTNLTYYKNKLFDNGYQFSISSDAGTNFLANFNLGN